MHIFSIVGPTAVGKSAVALAVGELLLAQGIVTGVDLISADSRQVYQGLEILSGADVPEGSTWVEADAEHDYPYVTLRQHGISLHGVALIQPTQEWSLAHFHQLAHRVIASAQQKNRAVIVVGGTGLYQTQLLQASIAGHAPPDEVVRERAEGMSVVELQEWLGSVDQAVLTALNDSDRANPRRLVRAIERSLWSQTAPETESATQPVKHAQHFLGLQTSKEDLASRIQQRVIQRLERGVVNEVTLLEARLEEQGAPLARVPARSACGLREVLALASGDIDRPQCIEMWTQRELSYAKRQATWWKKYPQVSWFSIEEPGWQERLFALVLEKVASPISH